MEKVLLTGMSGTGKSTLIGALAARGYKAVDTDTDEWSEWVTVADDPDRSGPIEEQDWVWREDRIQRLLSTEDAAVLFVSGCKSNQGRFYLRFDHIVLLSAPTPLLLERLATRTTNPYGKHPDELARILEHIRTVEPLLRRSASLEVDTSASVEQVIETILSLLPAAARTGGRSSESHAPTITDSDGETIMLDDDYFRRQDEERRARLAAPSLSDDDLAAMRAAHPEQAWFWMREWYDSEREIDEQRAAGIQGTIYTWIKDRRRH